jgi:hypothetical protein
MHLKNLTENSILLPLKDAAPVLGVEANQLKRLAMIRDIAFVDLDGKLYFRPEALREWVGRNESKVW